MCAYASATGFPPTGTHRKLTDQVVMRQGVACDSCNGSGLQITNGKRHFCSDCHGFLRRLSAADVVRLYQIVTARFPDLCSRVAKVQEAADRWHCGKSLPATAPKYFGREPLPAAVPVVPNGKALLVASITWRSGGRSDYLWTGSAADDLCVLWERTPELLLEDGEPWTEVFAWAHGSLIDPSLSAQRLLQRGWAKSNPAYEWLSSPSFASSHSLHRAISATSAGILSAQQIGWLFRAATRSRRVAMIIDISRLRCAWPPDTI